MSAFFRACSCFILLLFQAGDLGWVGVEERIWNIFDFIPTLFKRGWGGMGKTEAQDVDRTSKTVLVRTVSTLVTKQDNRTDSRRSCS